VHLINVGTSLFSLWAMNPWQPCTATGSVLAEANRVLPRWLRRLVVPDWVGPAVCEVNPDHGALDDSTLAALCAGLAHVLSLPPR
jgi:hypothetical protein